MLLATGRLLKKRKMTPIGLESEEVLVRQCSQVTTSLLLQLQQGRDGLAHATRMSRRGSRLRYSNGIFRIPLFSPPPSSVLALSQCGSLRPRQISPASQPAPLQSFRLAKPSVLTTQKNSDRAPPTAGYPRGNPSLCPEEPGSHQSGLPCT